MKTYNVSLEEEVVNEAKKNMKIYGGKLSPLINQFLKNWNKEQKERGENAS